MKAYFKLLNFEQALALVAGVCFSIAFLVAIYFFRRLSNSDLFNFTPALMILAVAVPTAIFAIVHVQLRAAQERQLSAQPIASSTKVESGAGVRRTAKVQLDSTTSAKDPLDSF